MPEKTVIVGSAIGLHARPAAIIAEAVVNAGVPVTLSMEGGEPVDAGSALMIMTLGAGNAAQVTVHSDDEETLKKVAELVQQDLDASPDAALLRRPLIERRGFPPNCRRKASVLRVRLAGDEGGRGGRMAARAGQHRADCAVACPGAV